ncbi:MAG: endonuclease domain-containing protein [Tepidisphaeraceae bacterium]|jgi:very-short-patch-repair endonuclease
MLGRHDRSPRLGTFARRLRAQSTDAERKLWSLLRGEQLLGLQFRRQHPIGGYIVDFVCLKANLVVELDGGQHADPAGVARDAERTRRLEELGLRVLRVPDDEMLKDPDAVVTTILRELEALRPQPYPPPGYRERE